MIGPSSCFWRGEKGMTYRRRFTLVELLVVIAIIAILAAMLLGSLAMARLKGKQADCINNIRQLTLAVQMYTDEWDGHFPYCTDGGSGAGEEGGWVYYATFPSSPGELANFDVQRGTLWPYIEEEGVYRCPADVTESKCSYGVNGDTIDNTANQSRKMSAVSDPSQTPYFLEEGATAQTTNDGYFNIWYDPPDRVLNRHNNGDVYGYCDGHVTWKQLSNREVYQQCNFLDLPPSPNW